MHRCLVFCFCIFLTVTRYGWATTDPAEFFATPNMIAAKLSPDGNHVAAIVNHGDGQRLVLIDANSGTKTTLLNLVEFSQKNASIRAITWIDAKRVAAQFSEVKKGVKDLLDTRRVHYLLIIGLPMPAADKVDIRRVRTKGWLVNPLPDKEDTFLYAKSGPYSKIYQIKASKLGRHKQKINKLMKTDGGQFIKANEIASVQGYATRWFIHENGIPAAVLNYVKNGDLALSVFDRQGDSSVLKTWTQTELNGEQGSKASDIAKHILPVAIADEENTFYCLDFAEEEERSVYKINYASGEKTLVFEADSFKIIDLILSHSDNKLIGVEVLRDGDIHNVYLDSNTQQESSAHHPANDSSLKSIIGHSKNGQRSLFYTESHNQPGQYLLSNNRTGKERRLGGIFPHLIDQLNSRLIEESVSVEGLDIPYLLTLPNGKNSAPYPLVVLPHGGPIGAFDHRYFDLSTQFLAANGYAVLRVNFRGSSGYTAELKEAGKGQWGKLMLADIYQATLRAVARSDVNKRKVCVFGMSYGGYAATMLAIRHPEVYLCAINVAGVSDLNLYLNDPDLNERQDAWLKEYVGDTVADYDALKSVSPVFLASQLQRPILIVHGTKDEVVDIEHAYRLRLMLEKHHKIFSWHIFPEGKHGFGETETRAKLFSKVKQFMAVHLKK